MLTKNNLQNTWNINFDTPYFNIIFVHQVNVNVRIDKFPYISFPDQVGSIVFRIFYFLDYEERTSTLQNELRLS